MASYILVINDRERTSGNKISAQFVAKQLLSAQAWPLYQRTPCRVRAAAGDKVIVYLAGHLHGSQHFIASATIKAKEAFKASDVQGVDLGLDNGAPFQTLHLTGITLFAKPVRIFDHLDRLAFIPKHEDGTVKKKWGCAMVSGMKAIPDADAAFIERMARRP